MEQPGMFTGYAILAVAFFLFALVLLLVGAWKRSKGLMVAFLGVFMIASLYMVNVLTEGVLPSGQTARGVGVISLIMIAVGFLLALFGGRKRPTTPAARP